MKKAVLFVLAALLFTVNAKAELQAPRYEISAPVRKSLIPRNSVSVELLGRGLIYSVNYDRLISPSTALGVGLGHISAGDPNSYSGKVSITMIPLYANFYMNNSFRHRFLLSGGATLGFVSITAPSSMYGTGYTYGGSTFTASGAAVLPNFGLGYEFRGGGFLFRFATYAFLANSKVLPWAGLSLGANF